MKIQLPEPSLVLLIGPSGAGKSTFAARHFKPTEIISSDTCRGIVSDDDNAQGITDHAFDLLHFIVKKRLEVGRLTVVDATNVQKEDRRGLLQIAREQDLFAFAFAFKVPRRICQARNKRRPDRQFGRHVINNQHQAMRQSSRGLWREGFRKVHVLKSVEEIDRVEIQRTTLWTDRRDESGPFDIIGDVHGCCSELESLLAELGYQPEPYEPKNSVESQTLYRHPAGRRVVFLGDLVDRGPRNLDVLRIAATMVGGGQALLVPGNHDMKLVRKLQGRDVQITHGLGETLSELEALSDANEERENFISHARDFLAPLVSHFVLDRGRLIVAHAGMKERYQGRSSGRVREFALYGETTGETDEYGLPVRHDWALEYRGKGSVVYGHTPVPEAEWLNNTINIDTGCVFGGKLTALRFPERECVSVVAEKTYADATKPFLDEADIAPISAQQESDDTLDLDDVCGKRHVHTELRQNVIVREENAAAALEVMSRFAVNPKWLIYLPPTMSPSETTDEPGLLEHPTQAFSFFRSRSIPVVLCEEKHMGSRAVVVICRDVEAARRRFGVTTGEAGICYTRTGRRFFTDLGLEREFLGRLRTAIDESGLWEELESDWLCLDCELMPWSGKAQNLLRDQYASVGAAARAAFSATIPVLEQAVARNPESTGLLQAVRLRSDAADRFVSAYGQYCWPVAGLLDWKLAPFHVLASEGHVHKDRDHNWHLQMIRRLCEADLDLLLATRALEVDLTDPESEATAVRWWQEMTSKGGEGMVVKPFDFVAFGKKGLVQPALKCRGPEYLRIIYGPHYDEPSNLQRLRSRGLGAKRSLALREFALGLEALQRFVRREPLRRIHECVFAVLALESEPVDPRL